jgi:hypothetical protein
MNGLEDQTEQLLDFLNVQCNYFYMPCAALARSTSTSMPRRCLYVQLLLLQTLKKKDTAQRPQRSKERNKTPAKPFQLYASYIIYLENLVCVAFFTVHGAKFLEAYPKSWACSV